jgi:hypothetical protein
MRVSVVLLSIALWLKFRSELDDSEAALLGGVGEHGPRDRTLAREWWRSSRWQALAA